MFDITTAGPFLAQEESTGASGNIRELFAAMVQKMDILHHPDQLLEMLGHWSFFHASVAVVVGVLCVLNGYQWRRWVIVLLAFGAGYLLGNLLSERMGESTIVALSLGLLCAIIATPLVKVAVAIFAGVTGAFIGANVWSAFSVVPPELSWAGAAMGFIILALASIILFRLVVVLFTSVGGAALVVFGLITILLQVPGWEPSISEGLQNNHMLIPLLLATAAVGGFVLQESRVRQEEHASAE